MQFHRPLTGTNFRAVRARQQVVTPESNSWVSWHTVAVRVYWVTDIWLATVRLLAVSNGQQPSSHSLDQGLPQLHKTDAKSLTIISSPVGHEGGHLITLPSITMTLFAYLRNQFWNRFQLFHWHCESESAISNFMNSCPALLLRLFNSPTSNISKMLSMKRLRKMTEVWE